MENIRLDITKRLEISFSNDISKLIENEIYNDTQKFCKENNISMTDQDKDYILIYLENYRYLCNNFKRRPNLINLIGNGKIKMKNIMNYQKLNNKWKKYQDDLEILNKEKMNITPEMATSDKFTCSRCKKNTKCCYFSVQTRSSDEPMTNFITCMTCNYNWRE